MFTMPYYSVCVLLCNAFITHTLYLPPSLCYMYNSTLYSSNCSNIDCNCNMYTCCTFIWTTQGYTSSCRRHNRCTSVQCCSTVDTRTMVVRECYITKLLSALLRMFDALYYQMLCHSHIYKWQHFPTESVYPVLVWLWRVTYEHLDRRKLQPYSVACDANTLMYHRSEHAFIV